MKFGLERFACLFLFVLGATIGAFFLPFQGYDDTYITYRHSYNLATGNGLVFNPGEVFLGTSTPGFAVALGILGLPAPDAIPVIANILSVLGVIFAGLALWEFGRMHRAPLMGFLAAVFWLTSPLTWAGTGGEMAIQVALILWSFVLADKSKTLGATALLALAVVVRPDAALACLVLFPVIWWQSKRFPMRELALFSVIALPPYLLIWAVYGSPIPGSMVAKSYQREMGLWGDFWPDARMFLKTAAIPLSNARWAGPRASADMGVVLVGLWLGVVSIVFHRRFWIKPMAWGGLVALMYTIANPPGYHWYLIPILWVIVVLLAAGIDLFATAVCAMFRRVFGQNAPSWTEAAMSAGCLILIGPAVGNQILFSTIAPAHRREPYIEVAEWIRNHVPRGTKVLHMEIGYLGFYLPNHKIIDALGLVHPGIAHEVGNGNSYAAMNRYQPEVILYTGVFLHENAEFRAGFKETYSLVASIPGRSEGNFYDIRVKRDLAVKLGLPEVPSVRSKAVDEQIRAETLKILKEQPDPHPGTGDVILSQP